MEAHTIHGLDIGFSNDLRCDLIQEPFSDARAAEVPVWPCVVKAVPTLVWRCSESAMLKTWSAYIFSPKYVNQTYFQWISCLFQITVCSRNANAPILVVQEHVLGNTIGIKYCNKTACSLGCISAGHSVSWVMKCGRRSGEIPFLGCQLHGSVRKLTKTTERN